MNGIWKGARLEECRTEGTAVGGKALVTPDFHRDRRVDLGGS